LVDSPQAWALPLSHMKHLIALNVASEPLHIGTPMSNILSSALPRTQINRAR